MNYKKLLVLLLFALNSCSFSTTNTKQKDNFNKELFKNNGFALIYEDNLYKKKIVNSKLADRELLIFQRNLKKDSVVKITNNLNNKSIIVKVGKNTKYPIFNNVVITKRIAKSIDLDFNEPYVEIIEILNSSSFVAKKAKTFDEEKQVADKAPVDTISISDLNENQVKPKIVKKNNFSYIIKIADFYFINTAKLMASRVKEETPITDIKVKSLSETNYRVFLGPFNNLISLKKAFDDISLLNFENIEIIKND